MFSFADENAIEYSRRYSEDMIHDCPSVAFLFVRNDGVAAKQEWRGGGGVGI